MQKKCNMFKNQNCKIEKRKKEKKKKKEKGKFHRTAKAQCRGRGL